MVRSSFLNPKIITALLLLMFLSAGIRLFQNAPDVKILRAVEISPGADDLILGWQELGQRGGERSAEDHHLKLCFSNDMWEMSNVAKHRRVDVKTDRHGTLYLKRWPLQAGDVITLGNEKIEVVKADSTTLLLQNSADNRTVRWAGGRLRYPDQEPVYEAYWTKWQHFRNDMRHWGRRTFDMDRNKELRLFSLGGGVNCPDRWKLKDAPPRAAYVYQYQGHFFLGPGRTDAPIHMNRPGQKEQRFSQRSLPLKGDKGKVERVIIGRTYYRVKHEKNTLFLIPTSGSDFRLKEEKIPEPRSSRIKLHYNTETISSAQGIPNAGSVIADQMPSCMKQEFRTDNVSLSDWAVDHLLPLFIIFCSGLAAAGLTCRHHRIVSRFGNSRPLALKLGAVVPAVIFIPLMGLMWLSRGDLGLSTLMFISWSAWAWCSACLMVRGDINGLKGNIWNTALFLAGAGSLILVQPALGADNTRWFDFAAKHAVTLAVFGWAMPVFGILPDEVLREVWLRFSGERSKLWQRSRFLLVLLCIGLLFIQWGFGGERGVFGIQPAELAKLLLVFVAAFVGMDITELRQMNPNENLMKMLWGFLKTLFLIGIALIVVLVGVHDISPVLIMTVFMLAWVWAVAPHPWDLFKKYSGESPQKKKIIDSSVIIRGSVLLLILAAGFTARQFHEHPEQLPYDLPQRDRFLVWAAPRQHPHSGEQVMKAMNMGGLGGWNGGTSDFSGPNGEVMTLPMVQNDFIGSFVLYKFGGFAGLILLLVQAAYIQTLFEAGRQSLKWSIQPGDYRQRQAGRILHLILYGLAWMHITHWFIAWGNALGLLPVMGQPMTWISAANSHMFCFGLPALMLAMLAGRLGEEV